MIRSSVALAALLFLVASTASAYTPLAILKQEAGSEQVEWLYWEELASGQPIPFRISSLGTPDIQLSPADPAIDEFEAIELAFRSWEQVAGVGLEFELGSTTTNGFANDGQNVIFFADFGNVGYGAVTVLTFDNTTGQILDVDIHMEDNKTEWRTSQNDEAGEPLPCPCAGNDPSAAFQNDIQGLATHEIGHALGLDHSVIGVRESADTPTMYPRGIFYVPGDPGTPPNSHYRSLELDDAVGLRSLYPPAGHAAVTARLEGDVHDPRDEPVFGAHVVARNVETGAEVGAVSGVLEGPIDVAAWEMPGLPPGEYELRVHPIDGSLPGLVNPGALGGIPKGLIRLRFPDEVDLPEMFHRLVYDRNQATPLELAAGQTAVVPFRPIARSSRLPEFFRVPRPLTIEGQLNVDVTGPLTEARLIQRIGDDQSTIDLGVDGSPFLVEIPKQKRGTLVEYRIEVETVAGETLQILPSRTQLGLSLAPILFISNTGSGELAAVDSRNLHPIGVAPDALSFPLGHVIHRQRSGAYATNFGTDRVTFLPFAGERVPPVKPTNFDDDGDGLLDALEALLGTDPDNPDSDGDLSHDGTEVSETVFEDPNVTGGFLEVLGGIKSSDGVPIGAPRVQFAVWNVTLAAWESGLIKMTPSGRYRLRLVPGSTYHVWFYDTFEDIWLGQSFNVSGAAGQRVTSGIKTLNIPSSDAAPPDTGTDPLNPMDGPLGLWLSEPVHIPLDVGADAWGIALHPRYSRYLYVTGSSSAKVYKIDTQTNKVVAQSIVGGQPKGIAISRDADRLFVANVALARVHVLDAKTLAELDTVSIDGEPHYVSASHDGSTVVVTSTGGTDLTFVDAVTYEVVDELTTGVPSGLVFLSSQSRYDLSLAGPFFIGSNELALIDAAKKDVRVIDLGPSVTTTSGMAIDAAAEKGWVIHYDGPELLEIDLTTGKTLRRLDFDAEDVRDVTLHSLVGRRPVRGLTKPGTLGTSRGR